MKSLQLFAIVLIATVLSFVSALAGCEGGGDEGSSNNNGYNEDDSNGSGGEDTNGTLEAGLIVATAPNDPNGQPFVGDFIAFGDSVYVEDRPGGHQLPKLVCSGVSVCEFEATGSVKIEFTHPLALFLNKYASANPDEDAQVVWDQPGDWGLAPNGIYRDDAGDAEGQATTSQDSEHGILLEWKYTGPLGVVNGNSFKWDDGEHKIVGTISPDLKEIKFHKSFNGVESDRTLTRVE